MAGRGRIAGTFWVAIIDGFRLVPSRSWRHLSQVPERLQIGPRLDSAMWPLFDCDTWCAAQGVRSIDHRGQAAVVDKPASSITSSMPSRYNRPQWAAERLERTVAPHRRPRCAKSFGDREPDHATKCRHS
jgi:hypothetical protein